MKDKVRNIIIVILILIAAACSAYLVWYYISPGKTESSYNEVKRELDDEPGNDEPADSKTPDIPVDFDRLQEVNPDVYAWIKIEGTTIDYPVVQKREDDLYYLNHTWEGEYSPEGAIFTQACNDTSFLDFNTVIYGHQMGDGVETMFHQLTNYLDSEFMEQHPEVVVYTPNHIRTYQIFAAVVYDDRHLIQSFNYIIDSEKQRFLDSLHNSRDMRNQFRDDVSVTINDKVLSLSTCITGEDEHRLLVEAVLADEK